MVDKATHIGVHQSSTDTQMYTAEENIKKARRALYSLMGSGLYGENGIDPGAAIIMLKTYVMPILLYGLEITLANPKAITKLQSFHKRTVKSILSLPITTADPAVYILSGLLPIEAEIDIKAITILGNILCGNKNAIEWKIAERQLTIKNIDSNSWFIAMRKICMKYNLQDPESFLDKQITKSKWKRIMVDKIKQIWRNRILSEKDLYESLKYLSPIFNVGKIHPLLDIQLVNTRDVQRLAPRIKITTGTYLLQEHRAKFDHVNKNSECLLCKKYPETLEHFLLTCCTLEKIREPIVKKIIDAASIILGKQRSMISINLMQLIIDPYQILSQQHSTKYLSISRDINKLVEPQCRKLVYLLHTERYRLLQQCSTDRHSKRKRR